MTSLPYRLSLVAAVLLTGGCETYYDVNDACLDELSGDSSLDPIARDGLLRINCYRRLTGLARGAADPLVQSAANSEINYVQKNPDLLELLTGAGSVSWLTQRADDPGFSGGSLLDRLDRTGYISAPATNGYWEVIHIISAIDEASLPSGPEAIEELMRYPVFRQAALQPSWVAGAYAEGELPQSWWTVDPTNIPATTTTTTTTATTTAAPDPIGDIAYVSRVYYLSVLYEAPHTEHTDKPVLLPKEEQVNVPLYGWGGLANPDDLTEQVAQVSYPVTFGMGTLDPTQYVVGDVNQYSAYMTEAVLVGPDGPVETKIVNPGDPGLNGWPSGYGLRSTIAVYGREPFLPETSYQILAYFETPKGLYKVDYSFTTASAPADDSTPTTPSQALSRGAASRFLFANRSPGALHQLYTPPSP